jgi:lipoyl(octanoyl) transferase
VELVQRKLGLVDYQPTLQAMRDFTDTRDDRTPDELWLLQHPPVFTQGQAGKAEHVLSPGDIPVVQVDRGGQVTYHGPGQWVVYLLIDLRRRGLSVRGAVDLIEQSVVQLLARFGIDAAAQPAAPGVYVEGRKIASLGLRVRRGCTYHGLALNVEMDLEPFLRINPCGYRGLEVTSMARCLRGQRVDVDAVGQSLLDILAARLETPPPH